jgi:hypothetical protein
MKKIKLFKLICVFTVIFLDIIVIILIKCSDKLFASNNILVLLIGCIIYGIPVFFIWGMYTYVYFKISKSKFFIYKDPSKGKKFENIAIFTSISLHSSMYARGTRPSNHYRTISLLLSIILLIVSIITKCQYIWLLKSFTVVSLILYVNLTIAHLATFWVIYVKFFKWLGFSWFEKDFNKTIAKTNDFLISEQYYEKQKKQTKQTKLNYIIRWFILIFIVILFLWFIDKLNIKKK